MLATDIPLKVVSAVLGHASIRITGDVYGHVLDPQRQNAADALAGSCTGNPTDGFSLPKRVAI